MLLFFLNLLAHKLIFVCPKIAKSMSKTGNVAKGSNKIKRTFSIAGIACI